MVTKLVRDKIPEIIEKTGKELNAYIAEDEEYFSRLIDKLNEEISEFKELPSKEELCDILEVVDAIIKFQEWDRKDIEKIKADKKEKKGGFERRAILVDE